MTPVGHRSPGRPLGCCVCRLRRQRSERSGSCSCSCCWRTCPIFLLSIGARSVLFQPQSFCEPSLDGGRRAGAGWLARFQGVARSPAGYVRRRRKLVEPPAVGFFLQSREGDCDFLAFFQCQAGASHCVVLGGNETAPDYDDFADSWNRGGCLFAAAGAGGSNKKEKYGSHSYQHRSSTIVFDDR